MNRVLNDTVRSAWLAKNGKREQNAKSTLSVADFKQAATANGFHIKRRKPANFFQYIAIYPGFKSFGNDYTMKEPYCMGIFYSSSTSDEKPFAEIVSRLKKCKRNGYTGYVVDEDRFYDLEQCNKAFAHLAKKLDKILSKQTHK